MRIRRPLQGSSRKTKQHHEKPQKIHANVLGQSHNVTLGERERERERPCFLFDEMRFSLHGPQNAMCSISASTTCTTLLLATTHFPPLHQAKIKQRPHIVPGSIFGPDQVISHVKSRHHLYYSLLKCTYRILIQAAAAVTLRSTRIFTKQLAR